MPSEAQSRSTRFFFALAMVAACVAINSQSLWIDESQTAMKAIPATLHGWWVALDLEHTSNMQMPLYMLYIWSWARLFGTSEIALRAANAPWFLAGFCTILHFLRQRPGLRNTTLLLYCLHPFVWYYLNEARPYLMQLSGALMVCGVLRATVEENEDAFSASWWWFYMAGAAIMCGAGLLGIPWAIVMTAPLARRAEFWRSMFRSGLQAALVLAPVLAVLAAYFAWTIEQNIETGYLQTSVASTLSIFYEQLGFLGLGPGRSVLRATSVTALSQYAIPLACLGLPLAWGLTIAARRNFGMRAAELRNILIIVCIPVLLIVAFGCLRHARILARHLTPMFPFVLLAEAYAVRLLRERGRATARAAAVLIVAMLTISSIEVRFAFRHSKDDYRSATAAAAKAAGEGKIVWWAAGAGSATTYYHLPLTRDEMPGVTRFVDKLPANFKKAPDEIFVSKPDLSDPTGTLMEYIEAQGYRPTAEWQAFTLWEK